MNKIVDSGLKIDLHIHSNESIAKDGVKVKYNTLNNIQLLIDKLNYNEVNICAITDHDNFSYEMYATLKREESNENCSLLKVLPGIEFSVCFKHDEEEKVIHIVTIFSDENENKVKNIEAIMKEVSIKNSCSEQEFLQILRDIDIDTIMIAHQKNTLTSATVRKNDANSLGKDKFFEFVYTDYFEAFEFKNKRNEVINKAYLSNLDLDDKVRFVTGTDCHDWRVYPAEDLSDKKTKEFPYTFVKCLPTFRGLVMAMTDRTRLKRVNSFFNIDSKYIENLEIVVNNKKYSIPLSRGINVIIGDNSIGKSMLIHAMLNFNKNGSMKLTPKIKEGYKKYLKNNKIEILSRIDEADLFCFDMQGEVRAKFDENKLNTTEFLSTYFPPAIEQRPYRNLIDNELTRLDKYLQKKFELDSQIRKLISFELVFNEKNAESISFIDNLRRTKKDSHQLEVISSKLKEIINELALLTSLESLEKDDINYLNKLIIDLKRLKEKYDIRTSKIGLDNEQIEKVATAIMKVAEKHQASITDNQKRISGFNQDTATLKEQLVDIIKKTRDISWYEPTIKETPIPPNSNQIYNYNFISKINIENINTEYLNNCINSLLKSHKCIDWSSLTEMELQEMLLRYDYNSPALNFFVTKLKEKIEKDFEVKNSIVYKGMDKYLELSSGFDAKIYFDLLSYETKRRGVYIIDQPEDNISQSAIKSYLLKRFKTMGEIRQIIMITHNPQFIVNLDIDNLIFMTRVDGDIQFQSGALEYASDEYSILDIVAQNIDGGLDSIQKRWKRYEKIANI